MLIIPSIDLKNGKVVDRIKFNKSFDLFYNELSENPVDLCKLWRSENAKTLHINDLDGGPNSPNKKIILNILDCLDIPVTLSSISNSLEDCELYLENGIFRVALCYLLIVQPETVKALIEKYTSRRIIFYAIANGDELFLWGKKVGLKLDEFLKLLKSVDASRLIFGNLNWNSENREKDFTQLIEIAEKTNLNITLYGGVSHFSHLLELKKYEKYGIDSVIISKPLYENNFPCQEIWRLAETT